LSSDIIFLCCIECMYHTYIHTYRKLHTCSAQRIPKIHDKATESISLSVNTYPIIQVTCTNGRYKVEVHKNVLYKQKWVQSQPGTRPIYKSPSPSIIQPSWHPNCKMTLLLDIFWHIGLSGLWIGLNDLGLLYILDIKKKYYLYSVLPVHIYWCVNWLTTKYYINMYLQNN